MRATCTKPGICGPESPPGRPARIMWAYSSPEFYELLVVSRRWPPRDYGAFIADAMIAALLPAEPPQPYQHS
jgi:hypothetical protein